MALFKTKNNHYLSIAGSLILVSLFAGCTTTTELPQETAQTTPMQTTLDGLDPLPADAVDGVLVKVGSEAIMLSDLNNALEIISQGNESIDPTGQLKNHTLSVEQALNTYNNLVDQKILDIKAKQLGINVDDEELTRRITDFLTEQNLTEQELTQQLMRSNKTMDEYREEFRKEIVKQMVIGRVISPYVSVTPEEVNQFYLSQTKDTAQIKTVKLRSLLIHIPEEFSQPMDEFPAVKNVQNGIAQKTEFENLVRTYSQSSDAQTTGGLLPPRPVKDLPTELQNQLANLDVGQIVGPIAMGKSVFFFQLLGSELAASSNLTKEYDQWKNKLLNQKFTKTLANYLSKERTGLKIVERPFAIR